jgi:hypothetical protein
MILDYGLRLLLLSSACFFVVYCCACLAVSALLVPHVGNLWSAVALISLATCAHQGWLPLVLALFAVAAVCVPGYLRFEPEAETERAGALCTLTAIMGTYICLYGLSRAGRAAFESFRSARKLRRSGVHISLPGEGTPVTVLDSDAPLVALTGIARSRVFISRALYRALSPEQLDTALRHEQAHRFAHDNVKRLLFLLAPDPFAPLGKLATLERGWARVTEWAADDYAAAGDPRRALTLAETLVRVARMGRPRTDCALTAQLISDGSGLQERVNRLIEFASHPRKPGFSSGGTAMPIAVLAGIVVLAGVWQSPVLYAAHLLLESLLR